MRRGFNTPQVRQFLSYFCVGGSAAVVEWVMFFFFSSVLGIHFLVSTCLAFLFSTTANWILGRLWTFKDSRAYENRRGLELLLVFFASAAGLLLNLLLMYGFVRILGMDTRLLATVSKVMATGIVFIWNFLIRKLVIYK